MKSVLLALFAIVAVFTTKAQTVSPVKWSFTSRKTADKTYEIVLTATTQKPWHIYSQNTPAGGPVPTAISFKKNPLVVVNGKTKEAGNLKKMHDNNFGVDVLYYSGEVAFVQVVKVKANAATSVSGTVEYMVCDDTQCLPPTKQSFSVKLQ